MEQHLNPWAGLALGLHNHTPDEPCRDDCTFYPARLRPQCITGRPGGFDLHGVNKHAGQDETGPADPESPERAAEICAEARKVVAARHRQ